jgi:hypothetical protein
LSLVPLVRDGAPAWLSYWLRDDFHYAVAEHIVDVSPGADPQRDHAHAVAALLAGLAEPPHRWYLATSRGRVPWADTDLVPTTAAEVEQVRRGLHAVLVCPAGLAPPSRVEAPRTCGAMMIGRDGWVHAIVGSPNLSVSAPRLGTHMQTDVISAATLADAPGPTRNNPRRRTVAITALAAATLTAIAVLAVARSTPADRPHASTSAPVSAAPGLLLPATTRFPGGRSGAGAAFDPLTGAITLFGGGRLGGTSADDLFPRGTWSWDVNGWHQLPTAIAPPGVSYPAFAYDEANGSAVLYGGLGGDGSTWQWNGLAWRQLHPRVHPPTGAFAAAAYDPRRRAVQLATVCCQTAGAGTRAPVQMWEWQTDTWRVLRAANPPALSRAPLITYDVARGELLLLTQGSSPISNDTDQVTATSTLWSLDGTQWRRRATPQSPPYDPLRDRLAYDPASHTVVLFQGGDLPTWTWNGSTWRALSAAGGPLYSGAMATDATAGKLLIFGGQVPSEDLSSVWTLVSGRWQRISG